jgi:hypothetical protein
MEELKGFKPLVIDFKFFELMEQMRLYFCWSTIAYPLNEKTIDHTPLKLLLNCGL